VKHRLTIHGVRGAGSVFQQHRDKRIKIQMAGLDACPDLIISCAPQTVYGAGFDFSNADNNIYKTMSCGIYVKLITGFVHSAAALRPGVVRLP
jgi:hypothetical protein